MSCRTSAIPEVGPRVTSTAAPRPWAPRWSPANPETVDPYELGIKSEWFEHRFRANAAVFDEKFDNIQRTATTAVDGLHIQTLVNAASATIKGVGMELVALPFEGVKLFATGGFTNAVYNKFTTTVSTDTYNPNEPLTELSFANLPRWTTDAGGTYNFTLPNVDGHFAFTAHIPRRSMQFGDFGNTPQEVIKAYGLLNGSISHTAGPWTVSLWGRNLTKNNDDEAAAIAGAFQQWPGIPRTYGLTYHQANLSVSSPFQRREKLHHPSYLPSLQLASSKTRGRDYK